MSTCRIKIILFLLSIMIAASGVMAFADEPMPFFSVQGVSGKVDSADLFVGKRVALVVIEKSCRGVKPFLDWRKQLSKEQAGHALMLCIGEGRSEDADAFIFIAPNQAKLALGITGSPMLLGIEENRVKWRIAGLIAQWRALAESWLEVK